MIKLELKNNIYSEKNVKKAICAYKEYGDIRVQYKREKVLLIFSNCKYDEKLTAREFENYLIGLENI